MKKLIIFLVVLLSIDVVYASTINAGTKTSYDFETTKKIIKEVEKDYYLRQEGVQYHNTRRKTPGDAPEDATSQDIQHTVCSGYVYNSYYEAFNRGGKTIKTANFLGRVSDEYLTVAKDYVQNKKSNDGHYVIYYGTKGQTTNAFAYQNKTNFKEFVEMIQPGDIFTFTGHAMVAYDVVTNPNTGKKDVLLLNSNGMDTIYSRLYSTRSLSYSYNPTGTSTRKKNKIVDVDIEGGIQYKWLSDFTSRFVDSTITSIDTSNNEVIVDCIHKSVKYYNASTKKTPKIGECHDKTEIITNSNGTITMKCSVDDLEVIWNNKSIGKCSSLRNENYEKDLVCQYAECSVIRPYYNNGGKTVFNYQINTEAYDRSKLRLEYPGLVIEKTVDKGDNNSVYTKDQLKYTIKVANKSNSTYDGKKYGKFTIEETFDADLVDFVSADNSGIKSGNKITWNINSLNAGSTKTLTYIVTVKDENKNVDKEINAIGKFYKQGNSSVYIATGTVTNKIILAPNKKKTYTACYDKWKTRATGLELIDKIYSCEWGKTFDFTNFRFTNLFDRKTTPNEGNVFIEPNQIYFNNNLASREQAFKDMILNNQWGGVTAYGSCTDYHFAQLKWIKDTEAYKRKRNFNDTSFKNGDVLIYYINYNSGLKYSCVSGGSLKTPSSDRQTLESGYYAFIYIDDKFVGVNNPGATTERNEFTYEYYKKVYGSSGYNTHLYESYEKLKNDKNIDKILTLANYETLLDKDYFVILRPELAMVTKPTSAKCPSMFTGYTGTYDGSSHTVTVSGHTGGTLKYRTATSGDGSEWTTTKPTRTNAGTTTVYVMVDGDNNHLDISCGSQTIVINKKSLTIKADDKTMNYKGSAPSYSYTATGFVQNETKSVLSGTVKYTIKSGNKVISNVKTSAVGEYTIVPSGLSATNYDIKYSNGKLIITTGATPTPTPSPTASPKSILIIPIIPTSTSEPIIDDYQEGDVNGDNKINNMDYVLVRNHIRKTSLLSGDSLKRADINKDNKINNMDYVLIRNIIRKK